MIKHFRKYMKAILWVVIASFVLWGAGTSLSSKKADNKNMAGKVFGKKISLEEYEKNFKAARAELKMFYGNRFSSIADLVNFDELTWDRIILSREAKRQGIKATDEEVINYIKALPIFAASPTPGAYAQTLNYLFSMSPAEFEEAARQSIAILKLKQKILGAVAINDGDVVENYKKANEPVKISYCKIDESSYTADAYISDSQIMDYHNKNKESLKKPEQANAQYIRIDFDKFKDAVKPLDSEINAVYAANKNAFLDKNGKPLELDEALKSKIKDMLTLQGAKQKAKVLMQELVGSSFDDPDLKTIAKSNGLEAIETGYFSENQTIPGIGLAPDFSKIIFEAKYSDILQPYFSNDSIYIVKLINKKPAYIPDVTEVKGLIKDILSRDVAKAIAKTKADELLKKISDEAAGGKTFEEALNGLGLKLITSDHINYSGSIEGIGKTKNIWLKCEPLKPAALLNEALQTDNGYIILRLDERTPMDQEKFAKEKQQFEKFTIENKRQEYFIKYFEDLRKSANPIINTNQEAWQKPSTPDHDEQAPINDLY